MDVQDLAKNAGNLTDYQFEQKLHELVRENYHYRNLNSANQKIILNIVHKHKDYIRKGLGIPYSSRSHEIYVLSQNKIKLKLSDVDLKDIKEILEAFRK